MSAAGISGASRKAGFGEGTPQQVSREGQNRRIADFGTVVETCSKTAADCPCPGFSVHRANRTGLSARCGRPFSFPLKIHFKSRLLPAGRGFFNISFALVIRATGFGNWRGREFFLSLPTTPAKEKMTEILEIFSLLLNTDKFQKCQIDNKKAANLFQTYCFRWPPVAAGIQFWGLSVKSKLEQRGN